MKINKKNTILVSVLIITTVCNYTLSRKLTPNLSFFGLGELEALAGGEGGQTSENSTVKFGCGIEESFISGYDSQGNPIIIKRMVPGERGACIGPKGPCSPYPCTRTY